MSTTPVRSLFLMSKPSHFAVDYAINPWMDPLSWAHNNQRLHAAAQTQWIGLCQTLVNQDATIELVNAVAGLPDFVFTANAAVVLNRTALLARFRNPERQREEPHYRAAFEELRSRKLIVSIVELPSSLTLEGAG